jgi:hypothetical protein
VGAFAELGVRDDGGGKKGLWSGLAVDTFVCCVKCVREGEADGCC